MEPGNLIQRTLSASAWTENHNKSMIEKTAPAEGKNSEQTRDESTSDDAACSVFLVICATDYEGDNREAVFMDRAAAIDHRDKLIARNRYSFRGFRVEEWSDGDTEGRVI